MKVAMLSKSVSALLRPTARRLAGRRTLGTSPTFPNPGNEGADPSSTSVTRIVIAAPIDGSLEETSTTPAASLFPWRANKVTPDANPFEFVWRWICNTNIMLSLNGFRSKGERLVHLKDIALGSKLAFEAAVEGVFRHRLMRAHSDAVSSSSSSSSSSSEESTSSVTEAPELHNIMGKDLADFYQHAVAQHCSSQHRALTYELQQVHRVNISKVDLIAGAKRGMDFQDLFMMRTLGLGFMVLSTSFQSSSNSWKELAGEMDRRIDLGYATLRVFVDVECTEVFAITNRATGEELQGSMEPRRVTHEILLESLLFQERPGGDVEMVENWTIVDIDSWLDQNQFWLADKLTPPDSSSSS